MLLFRLTHLLCFIMASLMSGVKVWPNFALLSVIYSAFMPNISLDNSKFFLVTIKMPAFVLYELVGQIYMLKHSNRFSREMDDSTGPCSGPLCASPMSLLLQPMPTRTSTVVLEELEDLGFVTEDENMFSESVNLKTTVGSTDVSIPDVDNVIAGHTEPEEEGVDQLNNSQVVQEQINAHQTDTPEVETMVRRCTRLHNEGFKAVMLPYKSVRKKSAVPKATIPAIMQIQEMQRLGVEHCHINPEDLSEERLRMPRKTV
jgi:hypothetical protein